MKSIRLIGKRSPFGWRTALVNATPLALAGPDLSADAMPSRLRMTVVVDIRDWSLKAGSTGRR